jgi:hypothetical protein
MISFGSTDKDFYCFAPGATANGYQILHIEMIKTVDESKREKWIPKVRERLWHHVHPIGLLEVVLPKPQTLIDFSSFHESAQAPLRTIEIPEGIHVFEILSVDLPKKIGSRVIELAVVPGTIHGIAFSGIVSILTNREPYWKRREQLRVLELLRGILINRATKADEQTRLNAVEEQLAEV